MNNPTPEQLQSLRVKCAEIDGYIIDTTERDPVYVKAGEPGYLYPDELPNYPTSRNAAITLLTSLPEEQQQREVALRIARIAPMADEPHLEPTNERLFLLTCPAHIICEAIVAVAIVPQTVGKSQD